MSNRHTDLTDDDLEWVTVDEGESRLRRAARPLAVAGIVAVLLVTATVSMTGGVAAQTTFTANDVTTTTPSGHLKSVSVAPNGTVEYAGLESQPSSVDVAVQVRKQGGTWQTVSTKSLSASGLAGNVSYDFATLDLLQTTSLQKGDFPTAPDGGDASTTLEVRVNATLVGAGPSGSDVTASSSDSFTVTVHNRKAGGGVTGRANTDAN